MGAPKGTPRSPNAGRKKGTPNKDVSDLLAIANRYDLSPFELFIMVVNQDWKGLGYDSDVVHVERVDGDGVANVTEKPVITLENRIAAAKEASKYIYSVRKAVELSTDESSSFKVVIQDYSGKK